jgi:hypothetical protein
MKEYFFLKNKDQNGPFTIDQLANEDLTNETLIWTEGMVNWEKLKDMPELAQTLKSKTVPTPPPFDNTENIYPTEVSGKLKVTGENTNDQMIRSSKSNQSILNLFIFWFGFHLFALLTSYNQVEIFNDGGKPRTDKFWPFVDFQFDINTYSVYEFYIRYGPSFETLQNQGSSNIYFNGFFVDYDWSEFTFYVGVAGIIYLFVNRMIKKREYGV